MSPFIVKVLNRLGLLKSVKTDSHIFVNGKKILVPVNGMLGFYVMHLSEPWMTKTLQKMKPLFNGDFVDVGVNLGQTLIKAQAVYENFNYVGFEPNSTCVSYVHDIIKLNKFSNCNLIPVGISNEVSILKLNFFDEQDVDPAASILEDFRPNEKIFRSVFVPVFDLSYVRSFLPTRKNPILKIDVEGAELEVLSGLKDWIREYEPYILIEILPAYKAENTHRIERQHKLQELLAGLGYCINRLVKKESVTLDQLDEIGIHGSIEMSDYVLCPQHLRAKLVENFK